MSCGKSVEAATMAIATAVAEAVAEFLVASDYAICGLAESFAG